MAQTSRAADEARDRSHGARGKEVRRQRLDDHRPELMAEEGQADESIACSIASAPRAATAHQRRPGQRDLPDASSVRWRRISSEDTHPLVRLPRGERVRDPGVAAIAAMSNRARRRDTSAARR